MLFKPSYDLIILYYYMGIQPLLEPSSMGSTHLLVPSTLHIQHKIEAEEHDLSLISVQ